MNKTQKLYDTLPYETRFSAKVVSCEQKILKTDGKERALFAVILDKTLFFPEEGGQSCDKGTLCGNRVVYVGIADGIITHYLESPLETDSVCDGIIDFSHRYRNMQNHTGEHIVSGLVSKHYGFSNVGFHIGSLDATMDYDGELSREMLDLIEDEANAAIYRNIEIKAQYYTHDALSAISYRSKKELFEDVRIVTIDDIDVCACCAPHVRHTGEVGMIKFVFAEKYKGGTRVHMHCGFDALRDFRSKNYDILALSSMLSAKKHEIVPAVQRLLDENARLSADITAANKALCEKIAETLSPSEKAICIFRNGIGTSGMRIIANAAKSICPVCAVFEERADRSFSFIIASEALSVKEILSRFPQSFGARGGGNDRMVQGTVFATEAELCNFFETIV